MTLDNEIISEERKNVDELRVRIKGRIEPELYEDDNLFQRFLRARDQNIDAAETMLRKHIAWRKTKKVATLLTDYTPPEVLQKYLSLDFISYNSDGTPIIYSEFGNMDTRGLVKSIAISDLCTYIAWCIESYVNKMNESTKKRGTLVDQLTVLFNFENFSLASATHKPTIEAIIRLVQMYDSNYPERLKAAYIINASMYFTLAWTLVRPFLTGKTFQKIRIYGKDDWQNVLLNEIDTKSLPAFLGGKLTDPDGNPNCHTLIRHATVVPDTYFIKNASVNRIPNAKKLVVNRMSKTEIPVYVEVSNSNIEWEFDVKNRDITFSVLFKDPKKNEIKEVVEKQRVETSSSTESGMLQCNGAGTYYLQFDNSYSWVHSKEIYYLISVTKHESQDL